MPEKIKHPLKVSIVGATGYTALELIRLLINHPAVELKHLLSQTHEGESIGTLWPHLKTLCDLPLGKVSIEQAAEESDVLFFALPHGEAQKMVPAVIGKTKLIDLSGDFRLQDTGMFEKYYGAPHAYPEALPHFVYGLIEANAEKIAGAQNIANPGCFAITAQLALLPLRGLVQKADVFAITGSSGSGKQPKDETHHPVRNHNVSSYKIGTHQHIPEIIQTFGLNESQLSFVPTSGPFTRGIHLTAFVETPQPLSDAAVHALFEKTYANAPFVRLKPKVQLAEVIGSNFCDLSVQTLNGQIVIQAVIDNLVKGAAGNAIQAMNLMCGFDQTLGLKTLAPLFP
jgi:N-acetyl-gamma-glutamyl-phosphate reductase